MGHFTIANAGVGFSVMGAKIDKAKCIGCGICVEVCPNEAIETVDGAATLVREEDCEDCGVCSEFCEQEAITVDEINDEGSKLTETLREEQPEKLVKINEE